MSISVLRSGYERGKYKPVQAYIDVGVLYRFNSKYHHHGDITKLIRNAFVLAISEDEGTEIAAAFRVKEYLPNAPPTTTIEIPCEDCVYPYQCKADSQCAVSEFERQVEAATAGLDSGGESC